MALPNFPLLLLGSLSFVFAACDSHSPSGPPQPASALYECRGVPGYSPQNWDSLKLELKTHPPECPAPGADTAFTSESRPAPATQPAQSVRLIVQNVILDADCRFLARSEDTISAPVSSHAPTVLWDFRLPDGNRAETGEYYVNSEIQWPDGRKDTTYQKLGYLNFDCGG